MSQHWPHTGLHYNVQNWMSTWWKIGRSLSKRSSSLPFKTSSTELFKDRNLVLISNVRVDPAVPYFHLVKGDSGRAAMATTAQTQTVTKRAFSTTQNVIHQCSKRWNKVTCSMVSDKTLRNHHFGELQINSSNVQFLVICWVQNEKSPSKIFFHSFASLAIEQITKT